MEITQEKINAAYEMADENTKKVLDALFDSLIEQEQDEEIWKIGVLRNITTKMSQRRHIFTKEEITLMDSLVIKKPYYIDGRGIYIPIINKVLAMEDAFNGKEVKWKDAVKAGAPTKDEWYIILYFRDDIQRLLEENGGRLIKNDFYWSSTEYGSTDAWVVYFSNGGINYYDKYYSFAVRPVAAF